MLANPVGFGFDEKNRFYVAETFRLHAGVTDIRGHMDWLDDDLACRTVDDRVAMLQAQPRREGQGLRRRTRPHPPRRGHDGDGKADKATVFADGFHDIADGIGAGLVARNGDVWYTCIPDLWQLRDTDGDGKADQRERCTTATASTSASSATTCTASASGPTASSTSASATAAST